MSLSPLGHAIFYASESQNDNASSRRAYAVAAAAELVAAKLNGGSVSGNARDYSEHLSAIADSIQEALKKA
ncbi:hypothetical protein [Pseudomonas panipatensis]|uniref:Uncharacterized protein n=1 Tax=Pseudomonas panipatensis TaxID=428992 RepID=A0A1G8LFK1_9PSED|nr:hypothetical protein [Pseudomonas panipatensis]SDI54474.1 hypothetical protein SAMN05216272_111125 [Pseudomonas panipatensis]SMP75002.1 hypothetical protein SAMN06295951_11375 [Pseudomonas panipatensis]